MRVLLEMIARLFFVVLCVATASSAWAAEGSPVRSKRLMALKRGADAPQLITAFRLPRHGPVGVFCKKAKAGASCAIVGQKQEILPLDVSMSFDAGSKSLKVQIQGRGLKSNTVSAALPAGFRDLKSLESALGPLANVSKKEVGLKNTSFFKNSTGDEASLIGHEITHVVQQGGSKGD